MKKDEFLIKLTAGLSNLPQSEVEGRILFYSEMLDDKMEEGMTEEDAVASLGTIESIIDQIIADIPLSALIKNRIKRKSDKKLPTWAIVLLAVGSPIWLALLVAAFAVAISLYAVIWAVAVSLWTLPVSFSAGAILGVFTFFYSISIGKFATAFMLLGAGIVCVGLAILSFYACIYITKGGVWLTKKISLGIKKCFTKKEAN